MKPTQELKQKISEVFTAIAKDDNRIYWKTMNGYTKTPIRWRKIESDILAVVDEYFGDIAEEAKRLIGGI